MKLFLLFGFVHMVVPPDPLRTYVSYQRVNRTPRRCLECLKKLRGGARYIMLGPHERSIEFGREVRGEMRDDERKLYAEPMAHVGNMMEKRPLPDSHERNLCVKFKFSQRGQDMGSCIVELFSDIVVPESTFFTDLTTFRLTKMRPGMMFEFDTGKRAPKISSSGEQLLHSEPFVLTMSRESERAVFRITSMITHSMDRKYQVVGRVLKGFEVLLSMEKMESLQANEPMWTKPLFQISGISEKTRHPIQEISQLILPSKRPNPTNEENTVEVGVKEIEEKKARLKREQSSSSDNDEKNTSPMHNSKLIQDTLGLGESSMESSDTCNDSTGPEQSHSDTGAGRN